MTLSGKSCLVTGANSGLGLAVSKRCASMGATTIMLCRSRERGENALSEITAHTPGASVEVMTCDLSSLESIHTFVEGLKGRHSKLDVLYNNAAVMRKNRTVTEDGFELMFQVNYLASFVLMNSLLELLRNSSSPFIVNNGRPSSKLRLDMEDLQSEKDYHMYRSFFKTKLCLLFASLELSRRREGEGIVVTMIDPGPFKSELVRDAPLIGWVKNLFSHSVSRAAENVLYHITSDEAERKNGKVFKERKEEPLTEYWRDTSISERLWSTTESLVKDTLVFT